MKIKILGSNGWYSDKNGSTTCVLIETKDYYVVLDAGEGIYKLDQHIDSDKPIFLFLSHFHFDHINGFHILPTFHFSQSIKIFGQPATKDILNQIVNHPFAMPFKDMKMQISVTDLAEGVQDLSELPFPVECRYLVHIDPCFGYRFNLEHKIISYCTDTGMCDNLLQLAQGADILFTECIHKPGDKMNDGWPHLDPVEAAGIARQAKVKKLLLIHFDPRKYPSKQERIRGQTWRGRYSPIPMPVMMTMR